MIDVLYGCDGSELTAEIFNRIKAQMDAGQDRLVLIVPEQFAYNAERELSVVCGDRSSLYAEVLTFSGLARRVFAETGGTPVFLDDGGRLLAVFRAYNHVADRLQVYGKSKKHELCQKLLACIQELKSYRHKPEDILPADDEHDGLSEKLRDLARIYTEYECIVGACSACTDEYPDDLLAQLLIRLEQSNYFKGYHIYIDGFTGFTPAEREIIQNAAERATAVTVTLTVDSFSATGAPVFENTRGTFGDLKKIADQTDTRIVTHRFEKLPDQCAQVPAVRSLAERLFIHRKNPETLTADDSIRLVSLSTEYAENENIAAKIREMTADFGYRYRDIQVVGPERRIPGLTAVLEKYGIPCFADRKENVLTKAPVKAVVSAVESVANGYRIDDVLRLAKTGFAGLDYDHADLLENYARTWNINGRKWLSDFQSNPAGLGEELTEGNQKELEAINKLRKKLMVPLAELENKLKTGDPAVMAAAVGRYMEQSGMVQSVKNFVKEAESCQDNRTADEYAQLIDILYNALAQFAKIMQAEPVSAADFAAMLRLVLSQSEVGVIPSTLDQVNLGVTGRVRFYKPRAVFVFGASEGSFPEAPSNPGLLTAADRKKLRDDRDIVLAGDDGEQAGLAELTVYRILSAPSDFLWMSCPRCGADGKNLSPSYLFATVTGTVSGLEILRPNETEPAFRTWAVKPCAELGASSVNGVSGSVLAVRAKKAVSDCDLGKRYLQGAVAANSCKRGPITPEQSGRQSFWKDPEVTVSRIETYNKCHFLYFMKYGLNLKDRQKAELDPRNVGNMVHTVLEKTSAEISGLPDDPWARIDAEAAKDIVRAQADAYAETYWGGQKNMTARMLWLFERLKENMCELIAELLAEVRAGDFRPESFELELGCRPVEINGRKVRLSGKADRVDSFEKDGVKYIRVLDYKTGTEHFSYGKIQAGIGIQLLLYLTVIDREQKTRPAGVLYIPVIRSLKTVSDGKTRQKEARSGILLNDADILNAMEHRVSEQEKMHFVPVQYGKDGPKGSALVSDSEFDLLSKRVDKVVTDFLDAVGEGNIECTPYEDHRGNMPCKNCFGRECCQFDTGRGGDKGTPLSNVKKEEFFDNLTKEDQGDGLDT